MGFHLKIEKHYKADKDVHVEMSCKHAPARPTGFWGCSLVRWLFTTQLSLIKRFFTTHTYARSPRKSSSTICSRANFRVFRGFTLCTAPMEMIPKNGEKRKFHDLGKCEMKANLGDFGVKVSLFCKQTQLTLRFNVTYVQLQCKLHWSAT